MTNSNSDAILLLTAQFSDTSLNAQKPLDEEEWQRLSKLLFANQSKNSIPRSPQDLFYLDETAFNQIETETGISKARMMNLLGRGSGLAIMRTKWESAGLWSVTMADADYPEAWKKETSSNILAPAVIYGSGNQNILKEKLVGMEGDLKKFPKNLASYLYSKGVNTVAPLPADISGTNLPSVGIVLTNLIEEATSLKLRNAIQEQNLTLISFYSPEVMLNDEQVKKSLDLFKSLPVTFVQMNQENSQSLANNTWTYVRGFLNQEGKYLGLSSCAKLTATNNGLTSSLDTQVPPPHSSLPNSSKNLEDDKAVLTSTDPKDSGLNTKVELIEQSRKKDKNTVNINQEDYFKEDSGDLLQLDSSQQNVPKREELDKFSLFLLSFLKNKTSLETFQSQASSEFLTKAVLSKWLKQAVKKGMVKEVRIKRKKFYQENC